MIAAQGVDEDEQQPLGVGDGRVERGLHQEDVVQDRRAAGLGAQPQQRVSTGPGGEIDLHRGHVVGLQGVAGDLVDRARQVQLDHQGRSVGALSHVGLRRQDRGVQAQAAVLGHDDVPDRQPGRRQEDAGVGALAELEAAQDEVGVVEPRRGAVQGVLALRGPVIGQAVVPVPRLAEVVVATQQQGALGEVPGVLVAGAPGAVGEAQILGGPADFEARRRVAVEELPGPEGQRCLPGLDPVDGPDQAEGPQDRQGLGSRGAVGPAGGRELQLHQHFGMSCQQERRHRGGLGGRRRRSPAGPGHEQDAEQRDRDAQAVCGAG